MKDDIAGKGVEKGVTVLVALAVLAVASVLAGYVRDSSTRRLVESLPEQQETLKELARRLAEYKSLSKYDLKPKSYSQYVRKLMYDSAKRYNMERSIKSTKDIELEKTADYVRMKYAVTLKKVTLDKLVRFLYEIQYAGRNLTPMEVSVKRRKGSRDWEGSAAIQGVSKAK